MKFSRKLVSLIWLIKICKNWYKCVLYYLLKSNSNVVCILRNGDKLKVSADDLYILPGIWGYKFYNPPLFDIKDGYTVVDIGAHAGAFSVFSSVSAENVKVYSYEPHPSNFLFLEENVRINNLKNIKTFQLGVCNERGKRKLHISDGTVGHSLYNEHEERFIEIKCISLQDVFELNGIERCDFLKLNCEGAEYEILFNAPKNLFKKIDKIALDCHPYVACGYSYTDLEHFLKREGFEVNLKFSDLNDHCFLYAYNKNFNTLNSEVKMEAKYIKCPICDCEEYIDLFSTKENRFQTSNYEFNVTECKNCGLVYINPQPDIKELDKFYPSGYYRPYSSLIYHLKLDQLFGLADDGHFKQLLKQIKKLNNGDKVLDVGCGTGWFLSKFQEAGYKVVGVEPNTEIYETTKKIPGATIYNSFLSDCNFENSYFDIVVIKQVLEHLTEPNKELSEINRILKPGGLLYIEVPNFNCIESKLFGRYWNTLEVPRHLYQYTTDSLIKLAKKNGFEPAITLRNRRYNLFVGPLATVNSFKNFLNGKNFLSEIAKKIFIWSTFIPLLLLTLVFRIVSEKDIKIIFKKRDEDP